MTASEQTPAYATAPRPRRIRRVKLALFLSSLSACFSVSLIGLLAIVLTGLTAGQPPTQGGFKGGAVLAAQLSLLNFIIFFLTVPAAAVALGVSIAQFPRRGITARKAYLRWGAIWGALLVGVTNSLIGIMMDPAAGLGALIVGGLIGGLAGCVCGLLFHAIVRPARQLAQEDISVF
ncbi:MAG: hypothetical protein ACK46Q_04405 [Hyphomonas sp.]